MMDGSTGAVMDPPDARRGALWRDARHGSGSPWHEPPTLNKRLAVVAHLGHKYKTQNGLDPGPPDGQGTG
ncbi:hypothetical protein AAFF_G00397710 [Aldrovandia affinis]|uniref:Uncharacterized protein n=1 Tax=Aldrovandia affinis TaxID=143900 RepID=A0AAD7SDD7_9TELE|nr:hypothetical protein AAFF_G00397710 [Aldrovandia affinis]